MEDHLKNKDRLEQEWVALCAYEAEPCATTIAQKVSEIHIWCCITNVCLIQDSHMLTCSHRQRIWRRTVTQKFCHMTMLELCSMILPTSQALTTSMHPQLWVTSMYSYCSLTVTLCFSL